MWGVSVPIQRCKRGNQKGWKAGPSGFCYIGSTAKVKAKKQLSAIKANTDVSPEIIDKKKNNYHTDVDETQVLLKLGLGRDRTSKRKIRFKKVPVWLLPLGVEREYTKRILQIISTWEKFTRDNILKELPGVVAQGRTELNLDAFNDAVDKMIDNLKLEVAKDKEKYGVISLDIGQKTSKWNDAQWRKTMKKVMGVDPFSAPGKEAMLASFTSENVGLITKIGEEVAEDMRGIINRGIKQGKRSETIASEIVGITPPGRFKKAKTRAAFIARDQVSKLNGQLTKQNQTSVGVEAYYWRDSDDSRVRTSHAAHNDKKFYWDKPPADTGHPGEDYQCRCWAEPIFDEIAKAVGAEPPLPSKPVKITTKKSKKVVEKKTVGVTRKTERPYAVVSDIPLTKDEYYKYMNASTGWEFDVHRMLRDKGKTGTVKVKIPVKPTNKTVPVDIKTHEFLKEKEVFKISDELRNTYPQSARLTQTEDAIFTQGLDISIARDKGKIVGSVSFGVVDDGSVIIEHIGSMVDGKNIGTQLIKKPVDLAVKEKLPMVFQTTPEGEGFYKKLGFKIKGDQVTASASEMKEIQKNVNKILGTKPPPGTPVKSRTGTKGTQIKSGTTEVTKIKDGDFTGTVEVDMPKGDLSNYFADGKDKTYWVTKPNMSPDEFVNLTSDKDYESICTFNNKRQPILFSTDGAMSSCTTYPEMQAKNGFDIHNHPKIFGNTPPSVTDFTGGIPNTRYVNTKDFIFEIKYNQNVPRPNITQKLQNKLMLAEKNSMGFKGQNVFGEISNEIQHKSWIQMEEKFKGSFTYTRYAKSEKILKRRGVADSNTKLLDSSTPFGKNKVKPLAKKESVEELEARVLKESKQ